MTARGALPRTCGRPSEGRVVPGGAHGAVERRRGDLREMWWSGAALLLLLMAAVERCGGVLLLPATVEPRWYKLELLPRVAEGTYTGRVRVNITCLVDTSSLVLHAHATLHITAGQVSVSHPSSRYTWSEQVSVVDIQRDVAEHLLILVLSRQLNRFSSYSIVLEFQGRLGVEGDHGLIRVKYFDRDTNNTEWYAVTNMSLDSARRLFPCFDEPSLKATFEISVGTPSHQHVFSNMPLADIENVEGQPGWYWKHFSLSPLMSTFSVGIVVLEFEHFSLAEGSFHIVGPTAIENNIETTITYLQDVYEYLQDYMDFPYPLLKLDIVFVPGVYRGASASWGLIVLGEDSVTNMDRSYLVGGMATQWVGHWVSPKGWREMQFSAGVAMHLGYQFLDKCNHVSVWDRASLYYGCNGGSFHREDKSEAEERRDKVFWILRMLQHSLTRKSFRSGFHRFFKSRKYKTFVEHDLWSALTAQGRSDRTLPQDVDAGDVAESWLGSSRFPVVTVTRDYAQRTFTITQHAFRAEEAPSATERDDTLWYIPVTYLSPSDMNVSSITTRSWMKRQREITIHTELSPAKFLVVNPAETGGMFVVNYDAANWAQLADALQRMTLSTAVRAKLLYDAWNLAYAGELSFGCAMNTTLFLKEESERAVWNVVDPVFLRVWTYLDGTRAGDKFKRYLSVQASASGARPSPLIGCESPGDQHQVASHEDQSDVTCDVLRNLDIAEFHRALKNISKQLRDSGLEPHWSVIDCLSTCIIDSEKIHRLLETVMLEERPVFAERQVRQLLTGVTRTYSGRKAAFLFLQQNFEALSRLFEDKQDVWKFIVSAATSSFTTEDGLEMVLHLYRDKRRSLGAAEAVVRASLDHIGANIRWANKNVHVIEHWLNHYFYEQELKQRIF